MVESVRIIQLAMDLSAPVPDEHWADGLRVSSFDKRYARAAHALMERAYAQGGEDVGGFSEWWGAIQRDEEYDPVTMFVVIDEANDQIIGFAHCWTSGHLKDIVISPDWQGKGVGTALIHRAMRLFRMRGHKQLTLKVRSDNPSAERLYRALGMIDVAD